MATITKRGDSYRIKVSCGYDVEGKQVTQSMTWRPDPGMTPNQIKKELNRQAVLFEEECSHGKVTANIKFETFAEQWFREYAELNHKDTTLQRERQLARRVYPAIGYMRIDKITARDIQRFINSLARNGTNELNGMPLSYKTMRHHLSFISTIFEYANKLDMISGNPCSKVTIPKNNENGKTEVKEKRIYTKKQAREFLKILAESPMKYRVFFTILMFTGFRRGELLGLEWKDINFEKRTVHVIRTSNYTMKNGMYTDTTKTEKSRRIIDIPQELVDLLRAYRAEQEEYIAGMGDKWNETDRLFTTWDGHPMHNNTPYTWLERECKKRNFPFYGLHSFRHFFASVEIEAGIDPTTVAAMLGHSTPQTTLSTYSHYFQEAKVKASNVVADVLLGGDEDEKEPEKTAG